jgi:hypothetical protein
MDAERITVVLTSDNAAEMAEALLDAANISKETNEQQRVGFVRDRAVAVPIDEITDDDDGVVEVEFDVKP